MTKTRDGTMFEQWSLVLTPFPFSNLEGTKKRPAVIVSNGAFNKSHGDIVCCLVTSKTIPEQGCLQLHQADLKTGRLPLDSKIKPYRLFTLEKTIVIKKIGELSDEKASETRRELSRLFA